MTAKTKTILKKILAYALMSVVLMLVYVVDDNRRPDRGTIGSFPVGL